MIAASPFHRRFTPVIAFAMLTMLAVLGAWRGERPGIRVELRSWIVAGHARHLFLQIDGKAEHGDPADRVEFTSVMLRRDYRYTLDAVGVPRVGRMQGGILGPPRFAPPPDNRLEAVYALTPEQLSFITRDRVFAKPYVLLGANSNAALRRVMERCGLSLPARVLAGAGLLGEFPGIDSDPGEELPDRAWATFGVIGAR